MHTDRDGLLEEPGFNSLGRPVDFVFGFQGRMLWRLISWAGKEGSTVSSIISDRWLILGQVMSVVSHCLVSDNRRCRAACWLAAYRPCPHTLLSSAWADGARCAEWLGGLLACMP